MRISILWRRFSRAVLTSAVAILMLGHESVHAQNLPNSPQYAQCSNTDKSNWSTQCYYKEDADRYAQQTAANWISWYNSTYGGHFIECGPAAVGNSQIGYWFVDPPSGQNCSFNNGQTYAGLRSWVVEKCPGSTLDPNNPDVCLPPPVKKTVGNDVHADCNCDSQNDGG